MLPKRDKNSNEGVKNKSSDQFVFKNILIIQIQKVHFLKK